MTEGVALGVSNLAIAAKLFVSVHTVRGHLLGQQLANSGR